MVWVLIELRPGGTSVIDGDTEVETPMTAIMGNGPDDDDLGGQAGSNQGIRGRYKQAQG